MLKFIGHHKVNQFFFYKTTINLIENKDLIFNF